MLTDDFFPDRRQILSLAVASIEITERSQRSLAVEDESNRSITASIEKKDRHFIREQVTFMAAIPETDKHIEVQIEGGRDWGLGVKTSQNIRAKEVDAGADRKGEDEGK